MTRLPARIVLFAALLTGAGSAAAHELWFEPDQGTTMRLYYGDYAHNTHERSPGTNDRWGVLNVRVLTADGQEKPLKFEKLNDRFAIAGVAGKGESLLADDQYYRIFEEMKDGKAVRSRWTPATRWVPDFAARQPKMKLDIVPTGVVNGDEIELQVFYQGESLPEVPIHVINAAGWKTEVYTDDDGKARVTLPWKGQYVALVLRYVDETPGTRDSEPDKTNPLIARPSKTAKESYDRWSHTTTLSFHKPTGLPELPRAKETLPASMLASPPPHRH